MANQSFLLTKTPPEDTDPKWKWCEIDYPNSNLTNTRTDNPANAFNIRNLTDPEKTFKLSLRARSDSQLCFHASNDTMFNRVSAKIEYMTACPCPESLPVSCNHLADPSLGLGDIDDDPGVDPGDDGA